MNAGDLIRLLQQLDPDHEVFDKNGDPIEEVVEEGDEIFLEI